MEKLIILINIKWSVKLFVVPFLNRFHLFRSLSFRLSVMLVTVSRVFCDQQQQPGPPRPPCDVTVCQVSLRYIFRNILTQLSPPT